MNDRKDDIIIGLLVIIIIMQVYAVFFGTPGASAPASVPAVTAPPGGNPEATADPEQRLPQGGPGEPAGGQPPPP